MFFTPGWDGPQQDATLGSAHNPGTPSNIIEPGLATISTTALFAATSPASSFVSDKAPAAATASNTQVSNRPDYPSLNPSIGAQAANAPNEHEESSIAGHHEEQSTSPMEAEADQPVQANPTLPFASASGQTADRTIETSTGPEADNHPIPVSPPAVNLPVPIPGVPGINDNPTPKPSEADQNSVIHHAKDQNMPQDDVSGQAIPSADSQKLPVKGPAPFVDGPLPGGWTSDQNTLEPLVPLQGLSCT